MAGKESRAVAPKCFGLEMTRVTSHSLLAGTSPWALPTVRGQGNVGEYRWKRLRHTGRESKGGSFRSISACSFQSEAFI